MKEFIIHYVKASDDPFIRQYKCIASTSTGALQQCYDACEVWGKPWVSAYTEIV
jgi:hypothetical protein